jgi:hypothetical protein
MVAHAVHLPDGTKETALVGGFVDCPRAVCGKTPSARSYWRRLTTRTSMEILRCKRCTLILRNGHVDPVEKLEEG